MPSYGLPTGTNITYGAKGFSDWVYQLAAAFGLQASTYPGHQETDRNEAGYASNPGHLNRGIDWAGPVANMQRFADYLLTIRSSLEQVIWQNPNTGKRIGVAGGRDVTATAYYGSDYANHTDHVHTRQSAPIPLPGKAPTATEVKTVGWTGDPTWLADVLIDELGSKRVKVMPGWDQRGHGDFKDIRGVMFHHTGNGAATPESIRDGRSDLPGPLSNVHVSQKGIVTVVAVGVCWHAGVGSYPWLPTNMGNWHLIGMECAWPRDTSISESTAGRERWPDAEIIAIRDTAAACLRKLVFGSDRVIGHKEYAGRAQGKWDPGNVDMGWFRGEVAKDLAGFQFPGEGTADYTPMPVPAPTPAVDAYANVLLHRGMVSPDVSKLQTALKRFYSKLVVDGIFGEHTEECVKDFQASKWRRPALQVDGIVGPATAAQLGLTL